MRLSNFLQDMEADNTVLPLVYFISARDRPRFPIKIGRSTSQSILRRMDSLQTSVPYDLEFMFVAHADGSTETRIHRAFAELRLHGEWFRRARLLTDFIEDLQSDDPNWRSLLHVRWKWRDGVDIGESGFPVADPPTASTPEVR